VDREGVLEILEGTFVPPEGTSDATIIVLAEISKIAKEVTLGSARIDVQTEEFSTCWRGVNERTSLSTDPFWALQSSCIAEEICCILCSEIIIHRKEWMGAK
jgi:hypothetical protein